MTHEIPTPPLPEVAAPHAPSDDMPPQGWYHDPFAVHEARWFSAGRATALVRDADVESSDEPPATEWEGPLELMNYDEGFVPDEMARVDDPPDRFNITEGSGSFGIGFS